MAPEQASFNALDVDIRADIYALGVILYELLTGTTPIQRSVIQQAAIDEVFRVIREQEPPRPSSRISTAETLPMMHGNRPIEQSRLSRLVKGDLDWIVMKALAKERNQRYGTAVELASDIERFTRHEPVTAGPPSTIYRLRKFIRRHRGRVAAAAIILLALVGGVAGTTWGLLEARHQQQLAINAAKEKDLAWKAEAEQRKIADEHRLRAELRMRQVTKMNEILCSIFHDLSPTGSRREGAELVSLLSERVERAALAMNQEALADPLVSARMEITLGKAQRNLGYAEKSLASLTKAHATLAQSLGSKHPDTLKSLHQLGVSYADAGQLDQALALFEQVMPLYQQELSSDQTGRNLVLPGLIRVLNSTEPSERTKLLWDQLTIAARSAGKQDLLLAGKRAGLESAGQVADAEEAE
jgi:tetratricopeptide (TPR) repeat protein